MRNKILIALFSMATSLSLAFGYVPAKDKTLDAWFVYWEVKNSLDTLKNIPKNKLNTMNLFLYSLDTEGNIINSLPNPNDLGPILDTLRQMKIKIIPTITNDIIYSKNKTILKDPEIISKILNNPELRKKHIQQIMDIANQINADGIDIDYEMMYSEDRFEFSQFIKELSFLLHNQNKTLSITVQQKTEDHLRPGAGAIDWELVSKYADQIIIMCYNYSSKVSKPGPICPPFWLKEIIKFAESQIPAEKISIALGLYGYDWTNKDCNSVNFKKVVELVRENAAELLWDQKSQSPYFIYFKGGVRHEVWFENQESILKKVLLVKRYGIDHIAIWHLGMLDEWLFKPFESFLE